MRHTAILVLALLAGVSGASAVSIDELSSKAYSEGRAKGFITGPFADDLVRKTRSKGIPQAEIVREAQDKSGCVTFRTTFTVPSVPDTNGVIVGDYVTTSRYSLCPGSQANPAPVVIACRVGSSRNR